MSRISLLLHKSKAKLRKIVNNNDILQVQWDITCLYPKGLSQLVLLLWNNKQWFLVTITCQDKNVLILSLLYSSFEKHCTG